MKVIAINGSPRKEWNTYSIIKQIIEGISKNSDETVEAKIIHLYDLNYTGCKSCMLCKKINDPNYGQCNQEDDLLSILKEISICDGLIIGSPIYFGDLNGMTKCFLERLLYPYLVYDEKKSTLAPKKIPIVTAYTMDLTEELMVKKGILDEIDAVESKLERIFSYKPIRVLMNNTYMVSDYSEYNMKIFSEEDKKNYYEFEVPKEFEKARNAGKKLLNELYNN